MMIILGYVCMCLIFGTTFLAIKVGIDAGSLPFFSAAVRFMAAGGILLIYSAWRGKGSLSLLLRKETAITGALLTFGTFSTLYWAEQHIESGLAAVLSATGPLMILLIQTFLLRYRPTTKATVGCVIGFGGVILLMLPGMTLQASAIWAASCLLILIGELSYSAGALYSKKSMERFPGVSAVALNAGQMLWGGFMLLLLSLLVEGPSPETAFPSAKAAAALLYLTVVGSMVGHTLFYWLVSRTNPVFPATWLYVSPLLALALGIVWYGESFSWVTGVGAAVVLCGIVLVNLDTLQAMFIGAPRRIRKNRINRPGRAFNNR